MQLGKSLFISERAVQGVLDSLIAFSTPIKQEAKSLYNLFLVEKFNLDPKYPNSDKNCLYIIQNILLNIVETELFSTRQKFFIDSSEPVNIEIAIKSIQTDSIAGIPDLISWSILYYLYAYPDLGVSLNQIADVINVAPRTIRRYRNHGISLLTNKLWIHESDFRNEIYTNQLLHKYQTYESERFIRRAHEIDKVTNCIIQGIKHVYIYGEVGIGKTVFVKQCIATLIRNYDIDHVVWVNEEDSEIPIIQQVLMFFRLNNLETLSNLFKVLKCIIIFDNINIKNEFPNLLKILDGSIIFYTSRIYMPLLQSDVGIELQLSNLNISQTNKLSRNISDINISADLIADIHEKSAGNPASIVQLLNFHDNRKSHLRESWAGCNSVQCDLLIFIPNSPILSIQDLQHLAKLFHVSDHDLDILFEFELIQQTNGKFFTNLASTNATDILNNIESQIELFLAYYNNLSEPWNIVFHLLRRFDEYIPSDLSKKMIRAFWRELSLYCNPLEWKTFITTVKLADDPIMELIKTVTFKEYNEFSYVKERLLNLIEVTGINGQFSMQAEIIVELIKIYRQEGQYTVIIHYINLLYTSLKSYLSSYIIQILKLEQAQLALIQNQSKYALALIKSVDIWQAKLLHAEIEYRLGNVDVCRVVCLQLLGDDLFPQKLRGIAYNLLGRCYQDDDFDLSLQYFSIAIEHFSNSSDIYRLGRCQINLSVTLLKMGQLEESIKELKQAEILCQITDDIVGLATIAKNKTYIHRLIVSNY